MRAIVIKEYGPVEGLVYQELPEPTAEAGHVVIEIKAFGLNHAEMHMRRGEWAESAPVPASSAWASSNRVRVANSRSARKSLR
ncbi:MAG TPA: hypothetical protein VI140_01420 [Oxalicibacterium sp.]